MFVLFPANGAVPTSVNEIPFKGLERESVNVVSCAGKRGLVRGHQRTAWNLWVLAEFREMWTLTSKDVPNPFYRGRIRGDIYISITVDDGHSGALVANVPPLQVASVDALASMLDFKADE